MHEKARAEQLIADARQAVQEQAGLDRLRPLIADLQQLVHACRASGRRRGPRGRQRRDGDGDAAAEHEDEEVIDAEFTRE